MTVGALCDPTADIPFASLSDITRCLGPVFTAAARVDPRGSVVVGAASLVAAAGYITPRAGDSHPALLARHVLSMLKTTRSSFPACLGINSFQNYSAEVETRAEYVGGLTVVRARPSGRAAVPARYCSQGEDAQFLAPFAASANTPVGRV